jgi:hypothetical protein
MAISKKAWMTTFLFSAWINYFILDLKYYKDISPPSPHVLIMHGLNSHVTINIVQRAHILRLHLLTLSIHCSHDMQPFDIDVFKPFKKAFYIYIYIP